MSESTPEHRCPCGYLWFECIPTEARCKVGASRGATDGKRCYLAGPMRDYPEYNFPAFFTAAKLLRARGYEVWSPAENDVHADSFDPAKDTAQSMRHYMKRDLLAVLDADFVAVLPGWERSQGACLEVHVARTCGIPVWHADTLATVRSEFAQRDAVLEEAARAAGKKGLAPLDAADEDFLFNSGYCQGRRDAEQEVLSLKIAAPQEVSKSAASDPSAASGRSGPDAPAESAPREAPRCAHCVAVPINLLEQTVEWLDEGVPAALYNALADLTRREQR